MTARKRVRTVAVPVVPAELPSPTMIPRNLFPVLMWVLGTAIAVSGLWLTISLIGANTRASEKEHDAQFQKVEQARIEKASTDQAIMDQKVAATQALKDHEREDIQSIKDLTVVIGQLATNADVGRQYLLASNKDLKASVADLAVTICHQANPKDGNNCRQQELSLQRAVQDATAQAQVANSVTNQATKVPVVASPTK